MCGLVKHHQVAAGQRARGPGTLWTRTWETHHHCCTRLLLPICIYATTNVADNDKKADFCELLQDVAGSISSHHHRSLWHQCIALSRDARTNWPDVVGTKFVDRATNGNGERLLSFCRCTDLCIADSWFPRKRIHHWTWYSNHSLHGKTPSITSSSRVDGYDASHSAVYSEAPNLGTPTIVSCVQTNAWNWRHLWAHPSTTNRTSRVWQYPCETANRSYALADSTDQWADFKNTITACATKYLGRRPPPRIHWSPGDPCNH